MEQNKTPRKMSPGEVRQALRDAATLGSKEERAALLMTVSEAFVGLKPALEHTPESGKGRRRALMEKAASAEGLDAELTGGRRPEDRQEIANRIADEYAALFDLQAEMSAEATTIKGSLGGRSGRVFFREDEASSGNARLDTLLDIESAGRTIYKPHLTKAGGGTPAPPCRYFVTVSKPGDLTEIKGAGLDPEFLLYLKVEGQLELRSYEDWLDEKSRDPSGTNRRCYEEELAKAHQAFDNARREDRYCKPQDIPAPGVFRGSRLLRLSVPIDADDFRENCSPSPIYEGSQGMPAPPELDYEELVRRYVAHLRTLPTPLYDLEGITETDIMASHLRDLGQVDPIILKLFVEASKIALRHSAFVDYIKRLAEA